MHNPFCKDCVSFWRKAIFICYLFLELHAKIYFKERLVRAILISFFKFLAICGMAIFFVRGCLEPTVDMVNPKLLLESHEVTFSFILKMNSVLLINGNLFSGSLLLDRFNVLGVNFFLFAYLRKHGL